jgi:4-hydroxybenzoate polyprenyltransferase
VQVVSKGDEEPVRACYRAALRLLPATGARGFAINRIEQNFSVKQGVFFALVEGLRLHQWAKNVLIFVPLLLSGTIQSLDAWIACVVGFFAWGTLASSTYLLNDLWDLESDRGHWSKWRRPIARGDLPIPVAVAAAISGITVSMLIGWTLTIGALLILGAYAVLTIAYSLWLKRLPIIDVFLLASLYTLRLFFGIELAAISYSPWLLVFSMFVFLSLSLAKRYIEVDRGGTFGREKVEGRGYVAKDAPLIFGLGLSTAASAVLIMVLYLINEAFGATFYRTPLLLWPVPALLFLWLGRIWLLAGREELDDDPIRFAISDPVSLGLGAGVTLSFVLAWLV